MRYLSYAGVLSAALLTYLAISALAIATVATPSNMYVRLAVSVIPKDVITLEHVNTSSHIALIIKNLGNVTVPFVRVLTLVSNTSVISVSDEANTTVKNIAPKEVRVIRIGVKGVNKGYSYISISVSAPEYGATTKKLVALVSLKRGEVPLELKELYANRSPTPISSPSRVTQVQTHANSRLIYGVVAVVATTIVLTLIAYLLKRLYT